MFYKEKTKIKGFQLSYNDILLEFLEPLLVQISFSIADVIEFNLKQSILGEIFQYLTHKNKFEKIKNEINK